ncbi:MAG: CBS domain-containing protein [Flavobacteriaceae bacterium]
MYIQTHILTNLPVFKVGDSLKKVIQFFKGHTFSHIAVAEEGRFLGLLCENDLETFEEGKKIEDYRYELETFFVRKDTNWLDVLEKFARNEANLLPVLGDNEAVLGYYDLTEIVSVFIDTPFFREPGGILVIEKGLKDYSFSEIAQIVESNNSRFIGGFITDMQNDVVQITIKVGATSLNEIIQTFRRYNYNILFGNNDDQFLEDLRQRSNYLDKYLNV